MSTNVNNRVELALSLASSLRFLFSFACHPEHSLTRAASGESYIVHAYIGTSSGPHETGISDSDLEASL
jgi:hypothetical protein